MTAIQVMNDVLQITLPTPFAVGDVNVYIIKGERLTLVDAGVKTEEAWHLFTRGLQEHGYKPEDIEQVVLTHHHPDHVGLLDLLPKGLPVYGHRKGRPWIQQNREFLEYHDEFFEDLFFRFGIDRVFLKGIEQMKRPLHFACKRDLTGELVEGDIIPGLPNWSVLEVPGHAQSHIAFYREQDGTLIGGDHLLGKISSNPLLEPPEHSGDERPMPQVQYNDSLQKLLDYNIQVVYSGHGEPIHNAHSLITHRLKRQDERAQDVLAILKEKPHTVFDVCKQLFPHVYMKQLALTISETVGQLDYLQSKRLVAIDHASGADLYYVV
ncbi:MBL fold metallo-hydrolase [Bacillus sp. HMF5848]|uniref:MBL fold metallo-hydrolase n=1 Tax=Bacillus sp. HMF5848 TaxID=2495421 RepID=UPI000F777EB4|nr:MBL fold metallo-hydrolase [Bacillus sp. HMF5848]RSK27738.1 MBL fold metallo-hydrolase [Bacillus sp. HMF5848]